jgi:osmotically-inducible protein OsmY
MAEMDRGSAGNRGYYEGYEDPDETFGGHGTKTARQVLDLEAMRRKRMAAEQARRPAKRLRRYVPEEERTWERLMDKIMANPDLRRSEIDVEVRGRQVTLRGRAETRGAVRILQELAEETEGVTKVVNELEAGESR